jgi:hypothetical protein
MTRDDVTFNYWRLPREPKVGRIVTTEEWEGLTLALFETDRGVREWRVLHPSNPVACLDVTFTHLGRRYVVGETVFHEPGHPDADAAGDLRIGPVTSAGTEMLFLHLDEHRRPPRREFPFTVRWADGTEWVGRYTNHVGAHTGMLRGTLLAHLSQVAGLHHPHAMSEADYELYCEACRAEGLDALARKILGGHEI